MGLKIQLVDRNQEMCESWRREFEGTDVVIHQGDFFDLETDCVVSPANSFGYMDGGLDLVISRTLGWDIETRLQEVIRKKYFGELLVGQAELVETSNEDVPYCLCAPTMRVPLRIGERNDTVNPYLASKAIFNFLKNYDLSSLTPKFSSITIPGMGTGVGKVPYDICAHQMKKAYDDIWLGNITFPTNVWDIQRDHWLLNKIDIGNGHS